MKKKRSLRRKKSRKPQKNFRKFWKKFWWLLWKDDSFKGWVFSVIFLVVFIMFIFFPFLRLVTGTALPLAIVESCSMYHQGNLLSNFDNWWQRHDSKYAKYIINDLDFEDFIFQNGFNKGDILFIIRARPEKLKVGDVVIFSANKKNPIIHRVIGIEKKDGEYLFSTIGDNNAQQLSFEKEITSDKLVGKAVLKLAPYIGWVKLIFYESGKSASERGLCEEN